MTYKMALDKSDFGQYVTPSKANDVTSIFFYEKVIVKGYNIYRRYLVLLEFEFNLHWTVPLKDCEQRKAV